MLYVFIALALSSLMMLLGALYRCASAVFLVLFVYIFLLDQARYLNHFYMVIIFAFLLFLLPANRAFSIDSWLFPKIKTSLIPYWPVWVLRVQMEIILIFSGIVKINPDWLRLEPLRSWLLNRADYPVVGVLFTQDWAIAGAAYGIILLHLIGAPLLLWQRTRLIVFALYAAFHMLNAWVFNIGIFPWFTLFASTIFFSPDWPLQLIHKFKRLWQRNLSVKLQILYPPIQQLREVTLFNPKKRRAILLSGVLIAWFSLQILVPLRHLLYSGNVAWTEEGHRFAWRMKLRDKDSNAHFKIIDKSTGRVWEVSGREFLTRRQSRKMPSRPDMILQYAHFLAEKWEADYNLKSVEVYVDVWSSLNGRSMQQLIDPDVDLTKVERNLKHATWIMPLKTALNE